MTKSQNYFYIVLVLSIILLRIPYLNNLFLSTDEILYLIGGRNLFEGEIPNVDFYSNKSPFLYFFYILPSFFENIIFATRVYTIFYILISCLLFIKLLNKNQNNIEILIYIIFFVILVNQHHGKALMPQIVGLPFIILIYGFCLSEKSDFFKIFFCGICASSLFLIHPSGIFLSLSCFTFLKLSDQIRLNINKIFIFSLGYIIPFLLLMFFYLIRNDFDLFPLFESLFIIPYKWSIIFSEKPYIFFKTFHENIIKSRFLILYCVFLIFFILNLSRILKKLNIKIIFLFSITLLGIIQIERNAWPHYIILIPGLILILSESVRTYNKKLKFLLIFIVSISPLIYQINDFQNIYSNNTDKIIDDDLRKAAKVIKKISVKNNEMLILDNHILYLMLNKKIPSKFKYHGYFENNEKARKWRLVYEEPTFADELENLIIERKIKYLVVYKKKIKEIDEERLNKYFDSKIMILNRAIYKIK
jgi:hypothetical protein